MLRIAIAGGGIGGSALISLLRGDRNTELAGILEGKPDAPGVILARKWGIPIFTDVEALVKAAPEVILNVTGDAGITDDIRQASGSRIEVIEGIGARFLWEVIERQKRAQVEVMKTVADQTQIGGLMTDLFSVETVREIFELVLAKALEMVDAPAGSIAVFEENEMKLAAAKGLSKRFLENRV